MKPQTAMKSVWILLMMCAVAPLVQGQVVRHVAISGNDQDAANTCFDPENPCRTINQALDVSSSGDTISIGGGVYTETLEIVRSLTLRGAGQGITILQAHAQPFTSESGVIAIDGGGGNRQVRISDMTIRHGAGNNTAGGGVHNAGASVTLESVTFFANSGRGGGFHNNEGAAELVDVTFTENRGDFGGGMYNRGADPVLTNVRFIDNAATAQGGGLHNEGGSSPELTDVLFRGNSSVNNGGAMTNTTESNTQLTNVIFENNTATNHGGALRNSSNSHPVLDNVVFTGNSAGLSGGAISNTIASSPVLDNVEFTGNSAGRHGGALHISGNSHPEFTEAVFRQNTAGATGGAIRNETNSSAAFLNAIFEDNTASEQGGGIFQRNGSRTVLVNTLLAGNTAGDQGGGIFNIENSVLELINATISENSSTGFGGGILNGSEEVADTSSVTLRNTILWRNTSENIGNEIYHFSESGSSVQFDHVLYRERDGAGDVVRGGSFTEAGSVTDDPMFVDAVAGDFRLQPGSPAIDEGSPETDMSVFAMGEDSEPLDLDGNPRVHGDAIDLGAYEFKADDTSAGNLASEQPGVFQLHQNYPNPFNPSTVIRYELPEAAPVRLEVFDLLGRRVATLVSEQQQAGAHQVIFDAGSISGGVYLYRLNAGDFSQTRTMMLIR